MLPDPTPFLRDLFVALDRDGLDVAAYPLDHLCYRVASGEAYITWRSALLTQGVLLGEHRIGGRPIATFRLHRPFLFEGRHVDVIELPAPKAGSPYAEGFEHAEFVVGKHPRAFAAQHPRPHWDLSDVDKPVNPSVRLRWGNISAKFHAHALADVIASERSP